MAALDVMPAVMLDELKAYLRLEEPQEDALLAWLLRAATEAVEVAVGQLLVARTVTEEAVVRAGAVRPARGPVTTLLSAVRATDLVALDAVLERRDCVRFAAAGEDERVRLTYRAGLGKDWTGIPEPLRLAVVRTAAHYHAHRDGTGGEAVPAAAMRLLGPWRVRRLA